MARPAILIVRLGAVGDVIRTLPLLQALRHRHPSAMLGWAVEEPSAGLLADVRGLDAVHVLRRRSLALALARPWRWGQAARDLRAFGAELRARRYTHVLDVHGTLKAAVVARLAGGERLVGFAPRGSKEGAHLLYDVAHPFPAEPMSRVRRALLLGAAEGLLGDDPPTGADDDRRVDFGLSFEAPRLVTARRFAASSVPLVVLAPFASRAGQAKRWPLPRFVAVGQRLAADGCRVVLPWGSADEREEATAALAVAGGGVELAPRTDLLELAEVLRAADLLVSGDTGPMHLAAAVRTRVLALFGPSDPVVNRPWGEGHRVLVRRPLDALPVADVVAAAQEMLAGGA